MKAYIADCRVYNIQFECKDRLLDSQAWNFLSGRTSRRDIERKRDREAGDTGLFVRSSQNHLILN